jgi:PAS domain S-box-containing protein
MQSTAVYCSDVMDFPAGFEGTKGIIHPDDLHNVRRAMELLPDGSLAALDFRIITTYGKVQVLAGKNVSLNNAGDRGEGRTELPWESSLQLLALRREADFLQQRTAMADTAERLYLIGSWVMNKSTGETWYSDGVYRIHGLPPQSLNAHQNTFHHFLHPEDRTAFLDAFEAAYDAEVPLHLEYRIQLADGTTKTARLVTQWTYNSKGQSLFSGILHDMSEEITTAGKATEANARVHLQQQVLKLSEQSWNTGYWFIDLITRKTTYSDNLYRIYGLKPQHVPGNDAFLNLVHPTDRERISKLIQDVYQEHLLPETEFRIVRPDGKQRQLRQWGKVLGSGPHMLMVGLVQDVTVQRGLEKKIAELNEKGTLQQLIQQFSETVAETSSLVWYPADGLMVWSEAFYRLLGYKPGAVEPTPRLLHDQIHPEDLKRFRAAEALVQNGQTHEDLHFRIVSKGGLRQLRLSFNRIAIGARELVVGVVKDSTKEALLHQKLSEAASYTQLVGSTIKDIVILTDTENTVLSWNAAAAEKTGLREDEALYTNLFELFPRLKEAGYLAQLQEAMAGNEVAERKARQRYLRHAHNYHLVPLKNESGKVQRILHVVEDSSKELELQQQLSNRLHFIESLVEASVDRIVVLDQHMNYLYWNRQAEEYYAIPKSKVIGRNILEIFPGFRSDPGYAEIRKVVKGETVYLPATAHDDSDDYFETYLIPVKSEEGEVTAVLWIVHDLRKELQWQREQRRVQQQLEAEHRRLKEAQAIGRVGSFEWDLASKTIFWSDEMYRIYGLEPQHELISEDKVLDGIHPDDRADVRRRLDQCRGRTAPHRHGVPHSSAQWRCANGVAATAIVCQ